MRMCMCIKFILFIFIYFNVFFFSLFPCNHQTTQLDSVQHDAKCTKKKGKEKMLKTLEHNGSEEKINQTELDSYSTTLTISSHTNTTVNPIQNSVYLAGNTIDLR